MSRGGLKSASIQVLDEERGLFMLSTAQITRTIRPFGSEGPTMSLEYNVATKNRLPTRFAVLVRLAKDGEERRGKALPMDLFGVSLHVLNLMKVTHFSRRQLFERFASSLSERFLSFSPRANSVDVPLSSFAAKNYAKSSLWGDNVTVPSLSHHDLWVCGERLVLDYTLSKFLNKATNPPLEKVLVPKDTSRKLLAFEEEVCICLFAFFFKK